MRFPSLIVVVLLCVVTAVSSGIKADEKNHHLRVDLEDGSRLVGQSDLSAIRLDIGFDELSIPLNRILRVDRSDAAGEPRTYSVVLTNDDSITGRLLNDSIPLKTVFGEISPATRFVTAIEVVAKRDHGQLPIRKGLVLYFPFNSIRDGQIVNQASDKHHGDASGVTLDKNGVHGSAAAFDNSSHIEVSHHDDLCPETFTLGGWLYHSSGQSGYQPVASKTHPSSWYGGYGLYCYSGDMLYFYVNGYSTTVAKAALQPDRWNHVMGTCNDETIRLYINGKMVQETDIQGVDPNALREVVKTGGMVRHVAQPLRIGSDPSHNCGKGRLDEFVMYDRALEESDIERIYQYGSREIQFRDRPSHRRKAVRVSKDRASSPSEG